jgi:hypothetical protein
MKLAAFALLFLCVFAPRAIPAAPQAPLTYEQMLERWDRATAAGETRTLPEYSRHLNDIYETDAFSAGLRDGLWIRFYARSEQIFGDLTPFVMIGAVGLSLFWSWRYLLPLVQPLFATPSADVERRPPTEPPNDSKLYGVGGWLLFLCIWVTILWPLFTFAGLHQMSEQWMYLFTGLIVFAIVSGISLWCANPTGLVLVRTFLFTILALNLLSIVSSGSAHPDLVPAALIQSAIPVAWLLYLHHSKRVRATYIR